VETLVPAVLRLVQQGDLAMARAVDALCAAPARLLGLADRGSVAPGLRADLFLWDPEATWTVSRADLLTRCGWSPFEGMTLAARPPYRFTTSFGKGKPRRQRPCSLMESWTVCSTRRAGSMRSLPWPEAWAVTMNFFR
jgi:hypothetical protein